MINRTENIMETFKSFTEVWIDCGGTFITWDQFKNMSAASFIEMLGEKKITFNSPSVSDIELIPTTYRGDNEW